MSTVFDRNVLMMFLIVLSFDLLGQKTMSVKGMDFKYYIHDSYMDIELTAATKGWVGIGFNDENSIVKSDLLLFHVVNGKIEGQDMYVVDMGNPQDDQRLGGNYNIENLTGWEADHSTFITFRIPLNSGDNYDFHHKLSEHFWLILAYSEEDDFSHHSRMRQHVPMTLIH